MTERLDAMTVRESNGKSYWTRIGVAFPAKQGEGWTVLLDAMPASNDGQFKLILREPLPPRDDNNMADSSNQRGPYSAQRPMPAAFGGGRDDPDRPDDEDIRF